MSTLPGSTGLFAPRWSPDGRSIAAIRMNSTGLNVFDVKTQRLVYSHTKGLIGYQSWSADSKQYLLSELPGKSSRAPSPRGGRRYIERVIDLKDFRYTGNASGWMGLDPTGAPLFLRNRGTHDVYSLTLDAK